MAFQVVDDDGNPLDAHFDLDGADMVFHSRGGTKGSAAALNTDYGRALRLLLDRIERNALGVQGAWVDSSRVQALPIEQRMILRPDDMSGGAASAFTLMSSRMKMVGRPEAAPAAGGNQSKRIKIQLSTDLPAPELLQRLGGVPVATDLRSRNRLPASELNKIGADHIWRAVCELAAGHPPGQFAGSTDYDLIADDGQRLPPKAVFGLAASEALGFEVLPEHFSAGIGSSCFRILAEAGFPVVPKGEGMVNEVSFTNEDRVWTEGKPKLVQHLKKERGAGLSAAKKAAFVRENGRLFCEKCGLDPVKTYGEHGAACIEVHHHAIEVADMGEGHETKLDELRCLCANCHRVVHKELKLKAAAGGVR